MPMFEHKVAVSATYESVSDSETGGAVREVYPLYMGGDEACSSELSTPSMPAILTLTFNPLSSSPAPGPIDGHILPPTVKRE